MFFYGAEGMGLRADNLRVHAIVAAWEWGAYLGEDGVRNGIRGRFSSWRRIDQASLIPSAKGTGAYLNSILAKSEAVKAGYDEAIMLNTQGYISEGSGENVFVINDGAVTTPPVSDGCLNGITRDTAITLLRSGGVEVKEQSLSRAALYYADEVFLVGTAAEVTPLREVDDRPIGVGKPGPITRMVQEAYADVVRGKVPEYDHWLTYVKDA
jgi:branched-chain amino acid aminotransferase